MDPKMTSLACFARRVSLICSLKKRKAPESFPDALCVPDFLGISHIRVRWSAPTQLEGRAQLEGEDDSNANSHMT